MLTHIVTLVFGKTCLFSHSPQPLPVSISDGFCNAWQLASRAELHERAFTSNVWRLSGFVRPGQDEGSIGAETPHIRHAPKRQLAKATDPPATAPADKLRFGRSWPGPQVQSLVPVY